MRPFEILMLAAVLPALLWPMLPRKRPRWVDYLPFAAVFLLLLHLLIEGYRWQMLPAYLLVVGLFLATLPKLRSPLAEVPLKSVATMIGSLALLLAWLVALALPLLLPVPQLPEVTGPHAIGTQTFYLVDYSRDEIYTADPGDKRELMVQLWYPAQPGAQGEAAAYLQDLNAMGPVLAERLGLPTFLLDHIGLVKLDAQKDVPVLADNAPYPVLLFSHGLRGIRAQNTAAVQELVSHGFVVVTIDHTYGNAFTLFPDGRAVFYSPDIFSGAGQPPHTGNTLLRVWAGDMGSVLDELAIWNATEGNQFHGRLDLSRVGALGHSTGGGAAVEFCGSDERCDAAVGLDAWLVPVSQEIITKGLTRPFLLLQAAQWKFNDATQNEARAQELFENVGATGYLATIAGASHYDFSDLPLFSPLSAQLGLSGNLDNPYVVGMVTDMTTAFFRQELQGAGDNLVMSTMVYPEMALIGRDG